jgi:hypothetical protein
MLMANMLMQGARGPGRRVEVGDGTESTWEINGVNDRPVGKPQEKGVMNIAASFSLSKKPRLSIQ